MKELVLLTGASTGIGREMARILARRQFDMILVSRDQVKLDALKAELEPAFNVKIDVIAKDLSNSENAVELYNTIKGKGLQVTILINNAGVGMYGDFAVLSLDKTLKMIELNISALVTLTNLFVADRKAAGPGKVMNVASLLSFFPMPYYSVYAATKAFVLSFSEALRTELSRTGITVTALCPGPTDSEFTTAEMLETNSYKRLKLSSASKVAETGINAMLNGRGTVVVGFQNKLLALTPRFSPRSLVLAINKFMARKGT